jgi:hypothetical protein
MHHQKVLVIGNPDAGNFQVLNKDATGLQFAFIAAGGANATGDGGKLAVRPQLAFDVNAPLEVLDFEQITVVWRRGIGD